MSSIIYQRNISSWGSSERGSVDSLAHWYYRGGRFFHLSALPIVGSICRLVSRQGSCSRHRIQEQVHPERKEGDSLLAVLLWRSSQELPCHFPLAIMWGTCLSRNQWLAKKMRLPLNQFIEQTETSAQWSEIPEVIFDLSLCPVSISNFSPNLHDSISKYIQNQTTLLCHRCYHPGPSCHLSVWILHILQIAFPSPSLQAPPRLLLTPE